MNIDRECALCGRQGDGLHLHHIFGGNGRREKSDRYNLVVYLCFKCHYAVHNTDPAAMRELHEFGQRQAMIEQGWTTEQFIKEFGRNYL